MTAAIAAFCGETFIPRGAGRTDSGVHARGQVAHIDLTKDWPAETVMKAVNYHMKPAPITILSCQRVDESFDARFSARARHYLYRIVNRFAPLALDRDHAWRVWPALDAAAMAEAAQYLIGRHDFTTFRASAMPGQVAGQDARRSERGKGRRGDRHPGFGALLPASSGALDRRQPEAGRRGEMVARRFARRARGLRPDAVRTDGAVRRALSHATWITEPPPGSPAASASLPRPPPHRRSSCPAASGNPSSALVP